MSRRDFMPPRVQDFVSTIGQVGIVVAKAQTAANRANRERAARLHEIEDRIVDLEAIGRERRRKTRR